jgi:hypothetical protein
MLASVFVCFNQSRPFPFLEEEEEKITIYHSIIVLFGVFKHDLRN